MIQMLHCHDQKGNKDQSVEFNGICRDGSFLWNFKSFMAYDGI